MESSNSVQILQENHCRKFCVHPGRNITDNNKLKMKYQDEVQTIFIVKKVRKCVWNLQVKKAENITFGLHNEFA